MKATDRNMLKAKFDEEKRQTELKNQHGITEKNVVVVERKSRTVLVVREFFKIIFKLLQLAAGVAIVFLAIAGLVAIVFPETRTALYAIFLQTYTQARTFIGVH